MKIWFTRLQEALRLGREIGLASSLRLLMEVHPYLRAVPFMLAAVVVGGVAVTYSHLFSTCVGIAKSLSSTHPYIALAASPVLFMIAAWLCSRFAPAAAGTGVPQVIKSLELDPKTQFFETKSILSLRVAGIIFISSSLGVLGLGSLGREGPMVHMAACIFFAVGKLFERFYDEFDHRPWVAAGSAAGIAAAFNAPLAGVIFVLEELAQHQFHRFRTTIMWSAVIGGVVSQSISGRYLFLGYPQTGDVPLSSIFYAALVGLVCALIAYPFHRMLTPKFQAGLSAFFRTKWQFAVFIGLAVSSLGIFVDEGTIGGGIAEIQDLLFSDRVASWSLIIGRLLGTVLSHLGGFAGGFLAPSLSLGAAIGSKVSVLTGYSNHSLLVMAGMAAFLAAVLRAPFTAFVIVMEMTDRHSAIFPLMTATVVSYGMVRLMVDKVKEY